MKIIEVKERNKELINELVDVWEDSVINTHTFLSREEINSIKEYVPNALKEIEYLVIAKSLENVIVAFMGVQATKLEMLFLRNNERRKGLGKELVKYGIEKYHLSEVTVNEQNSSAKGFYEHLGFETYKRSTVDEQGNNYPILYMKLTNKSL